MGERESLPVQRASTDRWSIAAAFGLLAAAFLMERLVPSHSRGTPAETRTEMGGIRRWPRDRRRRPWAAGSSPSEIPAKGWKDVLLRVTPYRRSPYPGARRGHDLLQHPGDLSGARGPRFHLWAFFGSWHRSPSIWTSYPASCRAAPSMWRARQLTRGDIQGQPVPWA